MVSEKTKTSVVSRILHLYGYAERQTTKDIKELAQALLGDTLTRQHGFELILARPVAVTEIANQGSLHTIWNTPDTKQALQDLEVLRSVESIVD